MLSPDEEKALEIGFDVVLQPINEALSNITGPSSKTIGRMLNAMLCTQMRNVVRVYGRAAEMLNSVGVPLAPVPLKLLKPILDGASTEEDEEVQEIWAALLANAGGGAEPSTVSPAYPEILRQLSTNDAKVMKGLFEKAKAKPRPSRDLGGLAEIHMNFLEYSDTQFLDIIESLLHHTLLEAYTAMTKNQFGETRERHFRVSTFGGRFMWACEPPKTK
jgi:hypothetical protein